MSSKPVDSKLARQLQKRERWENYTACLREVQKWLTEGKSPQQTQQIREMIDKGVLDPTFRRIIVSPPDKP